jgi:hypothetical protein
MTGGEFGRGEAWLGDPVVIRWTLLPNRRNSEESDKDAK